MKILSLNFSCSTMILLILVIEQSMGLKCAGVYSNPKKRVVDRKRYFSMEFSKKDTLCTLVHVRHKDPNNTTDIELTNDSDGSNFIINPVARSYDGRKWEKTKGSCFEKIQITRCDDVQCRVQIKQLGTYFLIHKSYKLNRFHKRLSRFFMQTTFGPTRDMISNWPYERNNRGLAQWLKNQTLLPPTMHREYFRSHTDFISAKNPIQNHAMTTQHPCAPYSRWKTRAFSWFDAQRPMEVKEFGDGKYLIVVDGIARTVVDSFESTNGPIQGIGKYHLCWNVHDNYLHIRSEENNSCYWIKGGNPPLNLPADVFSRDDAASLTVIDLPDVSNFDYIPSTLVPFWGNDWLTMEMWRLILPGGLFTTQADTCGALTSYRNIVGRFSNGDVMMFTGLATPLENTIENPLTDGGLTAITQGARVCSNAAKSFLNIDSCRLSTGDACQTTANSMNSWNIDIVIKQNVLLCGSEGEVANDAGMDPSEPQFQQYGHHASQMEEALKFNLHAVPHTVFLTAEDQLRQRMAFALSQILVVTQNQVDNLEEEVEMYFNYHDIFVRNALGNYRDVLREVSYSPMMAEMLSFLDSKSASYVLENEGRISRPDENFAREVMQLFTIGLHKLKIDGRIEYAPSSRTPIPAYENSDISTFARAWTGFRRQNRRFNRESFIDFQNRIDWMAVEGTWRDPLPKLDLEKNFIGDGYPLCTDLPARHFLRVGGTYRLLGSADRAEMQHEHHTQNYDTIKRFELDPSSNLFQKLCNFDKSSQSCNFLPLVELDENLECYDNECEVDNLNVVIVSGDIKYEYVRPACIELAFHNTAKLRKVVDRFQNAMCLHKDIDDVGMPSCCFAYSPDQTQLHGNAEYTCDFSYERTSYDTMQSRCESRATPGHLLAPDTCDWTYIRYWDNVFHPQEGCQDYFEKATWHWTSATCSIMVKVKSDGMISIVHDPNFDVNAKLSADKTPQRVHQIVSPDNMNYFKVVWNNDGQYPSTENGCANNACQSFGNDCLCTVEVTDAPVFTAMPTRSQILSHAHIGHLHPDTYDDDIYTSGLSSDEIEVHVKSGEDTFSTHSIFGTMYRGKKSYFRNLVSNVKIAGNTGDVVYGFRNPPQFLNIGKPDTRDAIYETEAVIDHYFYHSNTAPYLATQLIKRFGISNPSLRYVKTVATAFTNGEYVFQNAITFGDGKYGNLEAVAAAIVMDREMRSVVLDTDPTAGSLREPLIKIISFMRAMEYSRGPNIKSVMLPRLQEQVGQDIHATPTVFSFFFPDFSPPGKVSEAGLTAPEAQVLDSPKIVGMMNGLYSLVDIGLSNCFGGFGDRNTWWCSNYLNYTPEQMRSRGFLSFTPKNSTEGKAVVNELSLLLTGSRLNSASKATLVNAYNEELQYGEERALKLVQKLIVSTPEFHSTNVFESINRDRQEVPVPEASSTPYKAIVYVNLDGGLDSFNMLVPHSGCKGDTDDRTMYDEYKAVRGEIALRKSSLRTINATSSGQPCDTFGVHESLSFIQSLYEDEDLAFVSNIGVLQQPTTKESWFSDTRETNLFAHNIQQDEVQYVDIFNEGEGRGVCGRMLDVLSLNGFKPGSISVSGFALSLRSSSSATVVVGSDGYQEFNSVSALGKTSSISDTVRTLNQASSVRSSFYGETWSDAFSRALDENELMYEQYTAAKEGITTDFPDNDFGHQLESVATMMKTKDIRGTDRDIFNVHMGGFDLHDDMDGPLSELLGTVDDGMAAFVKEVRDEQGIWDDVAVVIVSEFGRILMGNTGNGSDHAWGGNYFVASGSIDGGKIMGSFPSNLTNEGPDIFDGMVIPSTPWESLWNGIAEWFGITNSNDLTTVLPNRNSFQSEDLWSVSDLFTTAR